MKVKKTAVSNQKWRELLWGNADCRTFALTNGEIRCNIYIKDNKCYNRCSKVKRLLMIFLMFKVGKERK